MKRLSMVLALIMCTALVSGCVTGRRVVPLDVATTKVEQPKVSLVIRTVQDARQFQNKPPKPSIPSAKDDVTKLTPALKARLIARQRNGYGKAMGDVVLPEGQTVESIMRALITSVLAKRGYAVVEGDSSSTVVVTVQQFWGWMTPGFLGIPFDAEVSADVTITINNRKSELHVLGTGNNRAQVASDANWALTYQRAFEDFSNKLQSEMELKKL